MISSDRILITGASGYVGEALLGYLAEEGFNVVGAGRTFPDPGELLQSRASGEELASEGEEGERQAGEVIQAACDLLDPPSIDALLSNWGPFRAVVHTASLKPGGPDQDYSENVRMVENLTSRLPAETHFILLSSVDVYGEPTGELQIPGSPLQPCSLYGESKVRSEEVVQQRGGSFSILRVAPVYGWGNMEVVKRRLFIPGTNIALMFGKKKPSYHLCHISYLIEMIEKILRNTDSHPSVTNVCDPFPILRSGWITHFTEASVYFVPLWLLYFLTFPIWLRLLPESVVWPLHCSLSKVFRSSLYREVDGKYLKAQN